jgi:DNA topoisomerase-1
MTEFYRSFSVQAKDFQIVADKRSGSEVCPLCNKHKLKKFKNKKSPGFSWLCKGRFSEDFNDKCTAVYPDINGTPNLNAKPPIATDHKCPKCSKGLTRFSRDDKFTFSCRDCKIYIPGEEDKPDYKFYEAKKEARRHATTCPECNTGKLIEQKGQYGAYFSCDYYPKCTVKMQVDVNGKPDIEKFSKKKAELETLPNCKKCKKGKMKKKNSSKGEFLGCTNYPRCKAIEQI